MMELLKQDQYSPLVVEMQVVVLFLGVRGHLDDIPVGKIRAFEAEFIKYMGSEGKEILDTIRTEKKLDPETEEKLEKIINEFKSTFVAK
jgi:F-type H+-transporting ATPase subunit alpha